MLYKDLKEKISYDTKEHGQNKTIPERWKEWKYEIWTNEIQQKRG